MCGLIAILGRHGQPVEDNPLRRGMEALVHRGPDDAGLHVDGAVGFGFRRLAIIDLSPAGHQPMRSSDGELTLVFNGEIYNHVEVRAELAALGHVFHSASDTEVILAAYRQWGEACVHRFNGMWAFVIHDRRKRTLFGSRDRLGVKPLYLFQDEDWCVLASEPQAIGATGLASLRPDWQRLSDAIRLGAMDHDGGTCFEGIRAIGPGCTFCIDARGQVAEQPFWSLPEEPHGDDSDDARWLDVLAALVTDSVRLRLRSDVPVGFTLSGGIDSSLLVCEAAAQMQGRAELLAFSYDDPHFDERQPVADTVARAGARLVRLPAETLDIARALPVVLRASGEPVHSLSPIANHALFSLAASNGVKVLLGGQGADEVFAGYAPFEQDRWHTLLADGRFGAWWVDLRAHARLHGRGVWPLVAKMLGRSLRIGLSALPAYRRLAAARRPLRGSAVQAPYAPGFLEAARHRTTTPTDMRLHAAQRHALAGWPLPMYLRIEDRMSMACSVEARLPFTDYRIVEHALRMPDRLRFAVGINKPALRRVAARRVPPSVTARTAKYGFPVGDTSRTAQGLQRLCRELAGTRAFRERGIYELTAVDALLAREAQASDVDTFFHLAQTELWLAGLGASPAPT